MHALVAILFEPLQRIEHFFCHIQNKTMKQYLLFILLLVFGLNSCKKLDTPLTSTFNENLKIIIREIFGSNYFLVKSIYFDKPEQSNWFVSYHHDLTISVDRKVELENFGPWTTKQNQFAVQPPVEFLENIFTIRIHLDDTDEKNGALKILPGSHANGICRIENRNKTIHEQICKVNSGGIMIMKPLLFHSSSRSSSNKKRRVIHLEFCGLHLPAEINWAEKMELI